MKILVDMTSVQPANGIQTNGGGEYAYRVLYELLRTSKEGVNEICVIFSEKKGENLKTIRLCQEHHVEIIYYSSLMNFAKKINESAFDKVFFPVCYPDYSQMPIKREANIVAVIHDLSLLQEIMIERKSNAYMIRNIRGFFRHAAVLVFGNIFIKKLIKEHRKLFELCDNITTITVSHYTRNVMEYLLEKKTDYVLYTPSKKLICEYVDNEESVLKKFGVENKKYFLLINASRWLKNNLKAIKVLDKLFSNLTMQDFQSMKVLVCGITDKYQNVYMEKIRNKDHFILSNFLEESELEVLYKNAFAFIFPSLLEGFGMPPSEALKYETMCLCSTSTSLPEIYRDSVIYFEPENDTSIAVSIMSLFDTEFVDSVKRNIIHCNQTLRQKQDKDLKKLCDVILS